MPLEKAAAKELISRRAPEWREFERHWRFLADSYEGGNRYKYADYAIASDAIKTNPLTGIMEAGSSSTPWYNYGWDSTTSEPYTVSYGQIVDRNLIPHLSETGSQNKDLYALRLHRTPVPEIVGDAVEKHLSRIYAKEIRRDGPQAVLDWWADVDGRGTTADRWMQETVAPLLLALGQIDVYMGHPPAPKGVKIGSVAAQKEHGLDAAIASIVLPENVLWWELDARKARYVQAVIFVRTPETFYYRHLTETDNDAYDHNGEHLEDFSDAHPFGIVPMRRLFDRRVARCEHVGKSRYEWVAQIQRAYYNALSERILSGVQQSHAQLMGPDAYLQGDSKIPVGPDSVLPMKALLGSSGQVTGYQGFAYLDPPKGAQEALRLDLQDFQDAADRAAALSKPSGMAGGNVTAQSGVSKIMDSTDGNARLAKVADTLGNAEKHIAELALAVLVDGPPKPADVEAIEVVYPKEFDLSTAADLAQGLTDIQMIASGAGALPELQGELLNRLIGQLLPGITDERLAELRDEVTTYMTKASAESEAEPEPVETPEMPGDGANSDANPDAVGGYFPHSSAGVTGVPPSDITISPTPS